MTKTHALCLALAALAAVAALATGCGADPDDAVPPAALPVDDDGTPSDDGAPPADEEPPIDEEPPVDDEPPLPANDAAVVSHSLPETLACEESLSAAITVQNLGAAPWSRAAGHKLGGVGDSDPFAEARVWLPEGIVVEPGASYTFAIEGWAPGEPGTYRSEWRMVQEGVEWFGAIAAADVVVPACPSAPVPVECAAGGGITDDRTPCLEAVAAASSHWPACTAGDELACHLLVREVARALAAGDPGWGLITKGPGQNQCTENECGPLGGEGYGVDVVAYYTEQYPGTDWQGFDVIVAIGAPGASLSWQVLEPAYNRDNNRWAPVP